MNIWADLITVDDLVLAYQAASLTGGVDYSFKIQAENVHGWSVESTLFMERAADQPNAPAAPITQVQETFIKVIWTEPTTNFRSILKYELRIKDNGDNVYTENALLCDGADVLTKSVKQCLMPMTELRSGLSTYDYNVGDLPQFDVRANNDRGWGDYSNPNTIGASIQTEPDKMPVVTRNDLTSALQIVIDWPALSSPQNGDEAVDAYNLQWDKGSDGADWYDLYGAVPEATLLQFILTTEIDPSGFYKFRIRAFNAHGWGEWSDIVIIQAARRPYKPSAPVTSIDPATGSVKITWIAPDDGADPISEYKLEITNKDNSVWTYDSAVCGGTNVATTQCLVTMDILTALPYEYIFDQAVYARVTASNSYGDSDVSDVSALGAKIRQIPDQMAAPTISQKTENWMTINWVALTAPATGNSAILAYQLFFDDSTGTVDIKIEDANVLTYTIHGLVGGTDYTFGVTAENIYGYSPISATATFESSDVPDQLNIVTTSHVGTKVLVDWDAPFDNYEAITHYEIVFVDSSGALVSNADCDGTDASVISTSSCQLEMASIIANTGRVQGDLIIARVRAFNANGNQDYSQENIVGALIEVPPPAAPTISFDKASSLNTQVVFNWSTLTLLQSGGSAVTEYDISFYDPIAVTWTDETLNANTKIYTGLTGGKTYKFKVAAVNQYGTGVTSAEFSALAAQAPAAMNALIVTYMGGLNVKIAWTPNSANNSPITGYRIVIKDTTSGFQEEPVTCNGSKAPNFANLYCLVPMPTFWSTQFNLAQAANIVAKVYAENDRGESTESPENAGPFVTVQTIPHKMDPVTNGAGTTYSKIEIDWTAVISPENGDSAITSYIVYWDQGTGDDSDFTELLGETSSYLLTTYILTGLTEGTTYRFKLRAKNMWGLGEFSDITSIVARSAPAQIVAVVTSIDTATGGVLIDWTAPDNRGDPISSYTVEIKDNGGTWGTSASCDGGSEPALSATQCIVPMPEFWNNFSLARDVLIQVQVTATNSVGTSVASNPNTSGALVRTLPGQMADPTEGSNTQANQIQVKWTTLTTAAETGSSAILSYELLWDDNTDTVDQTAVNALVLEKTLTALTQGQDYKFIVRAYNIYGAGPDSNVIPIVASQAPDVLPDPTTTSNGLEIDITWTTPANNGGKPVDFYEIQIKLPDGTASFDLTNCDGSDSGVIAALSCSIPHAYLTSNFGFAPLAQLQAKVRSHNADGWSLYSQWSSDLTFVESVPLQMNAPTEASGTTFNSINVQWVAMTTLYETGGTLAIDSYNLEIYDPFASSWAEVDGETAPFTSLSTTASGLIFGTDYKFRVRAENIHGWGPYSNEVIIRADQIPDSLVSVTTTVVGVNVVIAWNKPSLIETGGSTVTSYKIKIKNFDGSSYLEYLATCNGSNLVIVAMASPSCSVPMSSLTSATGDYKLAQGQLVVAHVQAYNSNGWSTPSADILVGALAEVAPIQMAAVTSGTDTSSLQIQVDWVALTSTDTGGAAITSYNLQWRQGTGTWTNVIGFSPSSLALTTILSTGISAGTTYKFQVRASNIHGWGPFSTEFGIKAASEPSQMSAPITSIDSTTGKVKITWTAPVNGGETITEYKVEIANKDNSVWTYNSAVCGGTNVATTQCLVTMNVLTATPYEYIFDQAVYARIKAKNSYGDSTVSSVSALGAKIRQVPNQMSQPIIDSFSDAAITVSWTALTGASAGNSAILTYNLYWDNASGTTDVALVDALQTSFTVFGLTAGQTYIFKVRASNIYGYGDFSSETTQDAIDVPGKPNIPIVTLDGVNVRFTWDALTDDHGSTIDAYELEIRKSDATYLIDLTNCDARSDPVFSALSCTVPMVDIPTDLGLSVDQLIQARVRAHNSVNWGVFSEPNTSGQTVQTVPKKMSAITFDFSTVSKTSAQLYWTDLAEPLTGGTGVDVDQWEIYWDQTTGTWTQLAVVTSNIFTYVHNTGLSGGDVAAYKIRGINEYGSAAVADFSDPSSITLAQKPDVPAAPTVTTTSIYVKIEWTAPASDNFATVTDYRIKIQDSNGDFIEDTVVCDGFEDPAFTNLYCLVPMQSLWVSPFTLPQGTAIQAVVSAFNERGESPDSATNAVAPTVEYVPGPMLVPSNGADTSYNQVHVEYVVPVNNGGSAITSYFLEWHNGGGVWNEIVGKATGTYLGLTYTETVGIVSGASYYFRVRAANKWGYGTVSPTLTVVASDKPAKPDPVTTSYDPFTGNVEISWDAPADNGNSITQYHIEIADNLNVWQTDVSCAGANPTVISSRSCIVPMLTVLRDTFSLAVNELVVARVSASNAMGQGEWSDANTIGVNTRYVPVQMAAPILGTDLSDTQLQIDWTALTDPGDDGYSTITAYNLYWDANTGTSDISLTYGLVTTFTQGGLVPGETYLFKVRAKNLYGHGPFSSESTYIPKDTACTMDPVTTVLNYPNIELTFYPPFDSGSTITEYEIAFLNKNTGLFEEVTSLCDGSLAGTITAEKCTFSVADAMSLLGY